MRYHNSTLGPLEAVQWLGGKRDGPKIEDLHALGIPVMPSAPGTEPLLTISDGFANRPVLLGNWLANFAKAGAHAEWAVLNETQWKELDLEAVDEEITTEAVPGLSSLTLNRVGYRRYDVAAGQWVLRHGGLSVVEMEQGGWEPLYTATSPDRARIEQ